MAPVSGACVTGIIQCSLLSSKAQNPLCIEGVNVGPAAS